jgi:UDP-glucose 4-epimerase
MKVLITGGAGFIGSHLCERMLAGDHAVVAIDDLSTGRYPNVQVLEGKRDFKLIVDTILNENLMDGLVRDADVVFHLASAVGVHLIIDRPVRTIETIVEGTDVVLRQARRYRKPVLITSTSEVYGKAEKVPFAEGDDVVLGPTTTRRWVYACAKMLDEFLALSHWHETRLPVICVRLFNTVGPRQTGQYGMVLPRFVQQALKNEPLTVYGDGEQTRCFAHVDDVVGALARLIVCPAAFGRVINLGNNQEVTMNQLARQVVNLTGSQSTLMHIPYDKAYVDGFEDMRRRVPDLTVAHELIGYTPCRNLDDIIRSIIDYWKQGERQAVAG